ncbi:DUF2442 domain-containing protein [Candidatus Poriferisocius sp.]|uniref:DUF2442 domain-containing protein n=1 Tax=Candidatus Poriferisocius sp. TaxID=3101276 RepID=UPI003B014C98
MADIETLARPVAVRACDPYRIWLRYSDGVEGEVDLSNFAGRGVFKAWDDLSLFASVHIGPGGAICWGDIIDMCPDALYLRITGISIEEYMPTLRGIPADA